MKHTIALLAALLLVPLACLAFPAEASELVLRYEQPAVRWQQEALPIGNGHMGAMLFGGIQREQIQFNEESLWIGDEEDTGAYQAFGDVYVQFGSAARSSGVNKALAAAAEVSDYRRELDIERAVHTGSVKGLRARGGFFVDIAWKHGKVTNYRIASAEPRQVKVRVNGEEKTITSGRN